MQQVRIQIPDAKPLPANHTDTSYRSRAYSQQAPTLADAPVTACRRASIEAGHHSRRANSIEASAPARAGDLASGWHIETAQKVTTARISFILRSNPHNTKKSYNFIEIRIHTGSPRLVKMAVSDGQV